MSVLTFLLAAAGTIPGWAQDEQDLSADDCRKCHTYEAAAIAVKGGGHGSSISCTACHTGHPPRTAAEMAPCTDCHRDSIHFGLGECLSCHREPHMPLFSLSYPGNAKAGCLTCHPAQSQEIAAYPGKHAELSCAFCHPVHRTVPDCFSCHDRHVEGQTMASCRRCHPPHNPREIVPAAYTPVEFCRPCHVEAAERLRKTRSLHGTMPCTYCHQGRHPAAAPSCEECHGLPHDRKTPGKQASCLECHKDAHLLDVGD